MSNIKLGLIIQGPIISTGKLNDTPNYVGGFNAIEYIETNIRNFNPFVDKIVISTWENSGLKGRYLDNKKVTIIENQMPCGRDIDNRRKQFVSIYEGAKFLLNNTDVTHVIKIRTDQLVNCSIIQWFLQKYDGINFEADNKGLSQKHYLFFSDMISSETFYAGDFVIGGVLSDIICFSKSVLSYGSSDLHPVIGIDYILKYLKISDPRFYELVFKFIPYNWQISNSKNLPLNKYWEFLVMNYFIVIPQSIFSTILWRGRSMNQIFPNYKRQFFLYENWSAKEFENKHILKTNFEKKSLFNLLPNNVNYSKLFTEYRRYYISQRLQYYLKQWFK